jgi:hypothetical protein
MLMVSLVQSRALRQGGKNGNLKRRIEEVGDGLASRMLNAAHRGQSYQGTVPRWRIRRYRVGEIEGGIMSIA